MTGLLFQNNTYTPLGAVSPTIVVNFNDEFYANYLFCRERPLCGIQPFRVVWIILGTPGFTRGY